MANIRIDLPQLGEGQYVEMRDPKFLDWGTQKKITSAMANPTVDAQIGVAEQVALNLIKSGHVLNEDDVPFDFPLNEETVLKVPAIAIEAVTNKYIELKSVKVDRKN